jgi:hypothetical protein
LGEFARQAVNLCQQLGDLRVHLGAGPRFFTVTDGHLGDGIVRDDRCVRHGASSA